MFDGLIFRYRIGKFHAQQDRDAKLYGGLMAKAKAAKDREAIESLREEERMEWTISAEEIEHLTTRYYLRLAERLMVAVPSAPEHWEEGHFTGRRVFTRSGLAEIRATIRKEQADRVAHGFSWGGFVIGGIGALTGLVAVILNR